MAASAEFRHEVRGIFTELMDKERATKVMEVIPSVDWVDLATKQDLLAVEKSLRHEFHQELAALRVEMYKALGEMRGEMHKSLGDVHRALTWHTLSVIGATGTMVGLAFGLAHWL